MELSVGVAIEAELKADAGDARHAQRGGGSLGDFDVAIEEIFAGGKDLDSRAEIVGRVGIHAEVSVQQVGVGIIVELVAAEAAFQTQRAPFGFGGAEIERCHVARDFGNPIAEIL